MITYIKSFCPVHGEVDYNYFGFCPICNRPVSRIDFYSDAGTGMMRGGYK